MAGHTATNSTICCHISFYLMASMAKQSIFKTIVVNLDVIAERLTNVLYNSADARQYCASLSR